ncbi:MAG TPA: histidine kinase dimerization/phosphoacceptor domain -containing protein [Bacteroidia bacterium]|nr:histidine kinase dimerization/phosphoacceptor domain -containing protein [Bacteroidia bacterium]
MRKDLIELKEMILNAGKEDLFLATQKKVMLNVILRLDKKMLSHEIEHKKSEERVNNILDAVLNISRFDYSVKACIEGKGDHFDALAKGINMLGDELQSSTISLHEKETLLKEIHHRVKNNLQVISSLLSLQSATINDPYSLEKFTESRNRIRSMAMVHEKLYHGSDLSRIDIRDYIVSLVNYLNSSYNQSSNPVAIDVDIGISTRLFAIDEAIPCGLIINELVTNAYKYAFQNKGKGNLYVGFHEKKEDGRKTVYTLEVKDNGRGLPPNVDVQTTPTLGLQLVSLLTEQLSGKLRVSRSKGTRFQVSFSPVTQMSSKL